jgi:hypothetical protein
MKNLMKRGNPWYTFNYDVLEDGGTYDIEVNGNAVRTYKWEAPNWFKKSDSGCKPRLTNLMFREMLFRGNVPDEPIKWGRGRDSEEERIWDICEVLSIDAIHYVKGIARIKKHGDVEWIPVDTLIEAEENIVVDESKIHQGQIWKLTIDDDPRFNNTMIMIGRIFPGSLEFKYQTLVKYENNYEHVELCTGVIDFRNFDKDGRLIDFNFDKIHFTLVHDNTNPTGSSIDRTELDKYYYDTSGNGEWLEAYPKNEPMKRRGRNNDVEVEEF